jgi:hypothetical protein
VGAGAVQVYLPSDQTPGVSPELTRMGIMKLRVDDITWREIDSDLVILDLRSSTYLTANASGTVLMRQLTEERTMRQLVQALVDAFGIPALRAQADVQAFVGELDERGLLESGGHERHRDPVAASGGR